MRKTLVSLSFVAVTGICPLSVGPPTPGGNGPIKIGLKLTQLNSQLGEHFLGHRDETLVERTKKVAVSELDPTLPSVPFEHWLRTEAGSDARYEWEVNDCGEETGSPGQNPSEVPTCVEADAWLKDGREIVIMIAMPPDVQNKRSEQKPAVFFAQLITTREKITLKQLSDLPAALVRTQPRKIPEIAK